MKKSILFALAAIAAFVGCEKAAVNDIPENAQDSYWVFVSEKPAISADTKTAWDGTKVDWSEGDKIKIACYNSTRGKWQDQNGDATKNPKAYSSTALKASDINNGIASFTYQTKFAMNGGGTYRFYSFFPYNLENASSADIADAPILTHATIKNEQPISSTSFDGASDILVGISTNTYTEQPANYDEIELKWKRLVAFPVITFKNLSAETGELIKSVTIAAQEGAVLTGAVDVNIYDGTIAASDTRTTFNSVSATHSTGVALDANNSFTTWFATLPFTATSLSVEIVTTAARYSREIDLSSNNKQFVQNKRNILAINMAEATKEALEPDDNVYDSLADLVAAGKPTSTERTVTVTLTNEEISKKTSSYICINVPTSATTVQEVKLYKSGVPSQWSVGGTVSGTITCPWLLYNSVDWELKPADWSKLTYVAPAAAETCATPGISISDEGIATITCTTEGAAIYYTLGESPADPTNTDSAYTTAVPMTDGQTIKAIAYKDGLDPSSVASGTYTTGGGDATLTVGKSYTWTLSSNNKFASFGTAVTYSNMKWTATLNSGSGATPGNYDGQNPSRGQQFGTSSKGVSKMTLTGVQYEKYCGSDTAKGIGSVSIKTCAKSGTTITVKATVGTTDLGTQSFTVNGSNGNACQELTFNAPSGTLLTGDVVFECSLSASGAFYVNTVKVN